MGHLLPRPLSRRRLSGALAAAFCAMAPHPAFALQPVAEFLAHATAWNAQNRAAHATAAQRDAVKETR